MKSYFLMGEKLLFGGRKATFRWDGGGGPPGREGCADRDWALRSTATYSGCTPDGRCPSSCVLICCAAAFARNVYKLFPLNIKTLKGIAIVPGDFGLFAIGRKPVELIKLQRFIH